MINQTETSIRSVRLEDVSDLKNIIDSSELFPSDLLDEMMIPYFKSDNENEYWFTYEQNNLCIAVAYFAPERMTNGTYNLYLIAVLSKFKGQRIGEKLLTYVENFLKHKGERILLVETSGLPEFERTREFYVKNNYHKEARIREFYDKGDDKIVFWKSL